MKKTLKVGVIINSNSRSLARRSHKYLSNVLTNSGIDNQIKETIFHSNTDMAGLEFEVDIETDRMFFKELLWGYLGMSYEMCSFKTEQGYPSPNNL